MDQKTQDLSDRQDVKITDHILLASPNYLNDVIEGITRGATTVIALTGHSFVAGDEVYFRDIEGTVELNGVTAVITSVATNSITLGINSSGYGAWTSGGTVTRGRLQRATISDLAEFFATVAGLAATDSLLMAAIADMEAHAARSDNPHSVTKAQVGLSNVPNTDATNRANHTGTQLAATISDFATAADARISAWVGAAPAALDTLDELAAALADDANFASTVTTALAGKANTLLSNLSNVATARSNLGLGTAATTAASDYITVANPFVGFDAESHPGPEQVRTNLGYGDMVYYDGSEYAAASLTFTNKGIDAASNTITNLDRLNTLANIPTSNVKDGMVYRPSDGLLQLRAVSNVWRPTWRDQVLTDALQVLGPPAFAWAATGTNNEYRLTSLAGTTPGISQPATLFIAGVEASTGTIGSLAQGTWAWGSSGGFNTVVVRLAGNANPQTQAYGYIRADQFSWLAKGNMIATVDRNHLHMSSTANGALTARFRGKAVPSTPYTMYALIYPGNAQISTILASGIGWTNGTAFTMLNYRFYNRTMYVTNFTDATTFAADPATVEMSGLPEWLAIRDDGTNRYYRVGPVPVWDKMDELYSIARTTFLTPTQVGIIDLRAASLGGAWVPSVFFE